MKSPVQVFKIDGRSFNSLDEFAAVFSRTLLLPQYQWHGNLDALNDILRGGFGTPDEGFVLRFSNGDDAHDTLGYPATVAWYEEAARTCHPSNRSYMLDRLEDARQGRGKTLFDMIVEIIRLHGPGGPEAEDNVRLEFV